MAEKVRIFGFIYCGMGKKLDMFCVAEERKETHRRQCGKCQEAAPLHTSGPRFQLEKMTPPSSFGKNCLIYYF